MVVVVVNEMNILVIYNSQTGFTEQYAKWIAQDLKAKCVSFEQAKHEDLKAYQGIIFGSWACAGKICKIGWFNKQTDSLKEKKLALFCTGAAPVMSEDLKKSMVKEEQERPEIKCFYFPGGLNYQKMGLVSKTMMKSLVTALKAKKNPSKEDQLMREMLSSSYSLAKEDYILPLVHFFKE